MPGLRFTETMKGELAVHDRDAEPFEFTLSISTDDLDAMLDDDEHTATMNGTVRAEALSPDELTVEDGVFNLFVHDPSQPETRRMRYRMAMTAPDGRVWYLDGFKVIHDDPGFDLWADTTTLYITVWEGADDSGSQVGEGSVHILVRDFAKQMTTMEVTDASSRLEELRGLGAFGAAFAGALYDTYADLFARPTAFDPDAPPRERRPLRVPVPEARQVTTVDGVPLRLTRYRGGDKGPVVLIHGLGVSSRIFTTDTIETNLTEFLVEHDYDVWLVDYRVSIEVPTADQPSTGDDVATIDFPRALGFIRAETGAPTVQVLCHCWGSTTFLFAMLAGLEGVRSIVASQIGLHSKTKFLSRAKARLHVPQMLDKLGVDSLTAYTDKRAGWKDKVINGLLKIYPYEREERCDSAACHRITFLYGHLYEHDQLTDELHENLHELFGVANIETFQHLSKLIRTGHAVGADGSERYMDHLDRLALPLMFIHGADNACWVPESTELTVDALAAANGPEHYTRHVIAGYGHLDCIYGRDAARDVYPLILEHFEATG